MGGDVAAHVFVHAGGGLGAGLFQVDDRRQRIELDGDVGQRVLGDIAALRQDDGQGLADMAHLVFGERHLGALIEGEPGDRRRRHEQRPRRPVLAEILRRIDRDDALARPRRGNVDRADRAWATLLRRNAACSMPGSSTSSTNSAWPRNSRASSLRLIGAPKFRVATAQLRSRSAASATAATTFW